MPYEYIYGTQTLYSSKWHICKVNVSPRFTFTTIGVGKKVAKERSEALDVSESSLYDSISITISMYQLESGIFL